MRSQTFPPWQVTPGRLSFVKSSSNLPNRQGARKIGRYFISAAKVLEDISSDTYLAVYIKAFHRLHTVLLLQTFTTKSSALKIRPQAVHTTQLRSQLRVGFAKFEKHPTTSFRQQRSRNLGAASRD